MKTIYLIGAPGSGKTTLTEALTRNWIEVAKHDDPVKWREHQTPYGTAISLGWLRPTFGGTDTLGNAAILEIEPWYPTINHDIVYGEGDRLANRRFFDLAIMYGEFHLFYLDTHPDRAAQRRKARAAITGKEQNPSWVKGRETKHRNLAIEYNATFIPDALTPDEGASIIREVVFPTLQ